MVEHSFATISGGSCLGFRYYRRTARHYQTFLTFAISQVINKAYVTLISATVYLFGLSVPRLLMTHSDVYSMGMFFFGIVAVYVTAGIMLIGAVIQWMTGKRISTAWLWIRRAVLGIALIGICCIAYGYFIEPYWLEVKHVRLECAKFSTATRPIKVILISDLHCDRRHLRENDLPALIEAEHPDCVLFAGDCANVATEIPRFQKILKQISGTTPTYGVQGNWDADQWRHIKIFENTGVHELDGSSDQLDIAGQKVTFAGVGYGSADRIDKALKSIPSNSFCIFLSHSPDLVPALAAKSVDLFCAGHTHGGQIALPFYGAINTGCATGKKFESGLYKVGNMYIYVNRGVGVDGWGPRVRFCARPEITVLELVQSHSLNK
jgi:uncharacterized protein